MPQILTLEILKIPRMHKSMNTACSLCVLGSTRFKSSWIQAHSRNRDRSGVRTPFPSSATSLAPENRCDPSQHERHVSGPEGLCPQNSSYTLSMMRCGLPCKTVADLFAFSCLPFVAVRYFSDISWILYLLRPPLCTHIF